MSLIKVHYDDKYLKEMFHEAVKEVKKKGDRGPYYSDGRHMYSFEMLSALKDMAVNGTYPDGTFGDMDVSVWELFRACITDGIYADDYAEERMKADSERR